MQALRENSASSAASATVVGFGFCATATWKKPSVKDSLGVGPVGSTEKYFGYLNSALTSSANRLMNVLPLCITTGIAGATMLVAYPLSTSSTLSTSRSLV